jgi:hypothetical protein
VIEEEMGHIMEYWDIEWNIPPIEIDHLETQHPEVEQIRDDGPGNTQKTIPHLREKSKEQDKGRSIHQRKKSKTSK